MRKSLLALLTLSLALLSLLITPTIAGVIIPPSSPIPINQISSSTDSNLLGYVFEFANNGQVQPASYASISVPIPSSIPYYYNPNEYWYNNMYAFWVALSPYTIGNGASTTFLQAGVDLLENQSVKYVLLFVYLVVNNNAHPLVSYQYPYSQFAGTTMNIYLYLSNGNVVAQFSDGSFSYTYNTGISFTPYSALVMGEAPPMTQNLNGKNYTVQFYPTPNETFSGISFNIIGSPATAVGYETIKYATNYPIANNYISSNYAWAFAWLSSSPSFSANAYTSSSSAQISGTLQLSYTETPLGLLYIA
ncbi:hypothetical protein [Saccharolobus islandicus]|uniref:Thermopsin n=1 Tax=Saccharolobus islandicus (strain M.16.27) TaxID=427318 RepID=C3N2L1_SACI3|nr:hypothetical protein [Sulfolobus islandicus]ACP54499.1 hypothetical protein M1627_0502 [Sulfolobus islandicus M.16.27]